MKSNPPSPQTMEHDAANGMRCQSAHMLLLAAATLDAGSPSQGSQFAGLPQRPPSNQLPIGPGRRLAWPESHHSAS
jgi:hypothetical protein